MFERYTEPARRVIFLARYEASQFGSTTIESEHLLLGLFREDRKLPNRLHHSSEVESIRREIESRITIRQKVSTSIDLPLSYECKRILACAGEEAKTLNHRHIGTEHLLLGILREERCVAAEILYQHGLRWQAIHDELEHGAVDQKPTTIPARPGLSAAITNALETACDEAANRGESRVEPDHLLLGLLSDQNSQIARFLEKHGVTTKELQNEMNRQRGINP